MSFSLEKSYKNDYPFKLGTTSFIFPGTYSYNIKKLGPHLDEIELLFLESGKNSLPSKKQIEEFGLLAGEYEITYNVHLPIDISLGDSDPFLRSAAVETILRVVELAAPLSPSTYTLHLAYNEKGHENHQIESWLKYIRRSIKNIVSEGIDSQLISIETLSYPFAWVEGIIEDFDLSVCMDIGHLFVYGFDPIHTYHAYSKRISIIHLHGVEKNKDHIGLERLSIQHLKQVMNILKKFTGIVSLEVFSYEHLASSLICLKRIWG